MQNDYSKLKNVPNELKNVKAWICWKAIWDEKKKKYNKIPINPYNGYNAKSNDPATWSDFNIAVKACKKNKLAGVGFVFSDNGYFGIDIDNCIDDKGFSKLAQDVLTTVVSYTEKSPSGKGLHIIARGKLPEGGRRNKNLEMYDNGRFFTVTGDVLEGYREIEEQSVQVAKVHKKYIEAKKKTEQRKEPIPISLSENEILEKAFRAKNGQRFQDLWQGNWQGVYPSQSEADQAFSNMLAFWTGRDEAAIDSIFRKSGLYRPKWDKVHNGKDTYGQMTIENAVRDCQAVYEGNRQQNIYDNRGAERKKKKRFTFDDTGNAQRLIMNHGEDLRYSFINNCWYIWNGTRWEEDKTGEIKRRADKTIKSMYDEARDEEDEERAKALTKWITQCRNANRKKNMIIEAQHIEGIPVLPEELDNDPWLLNCSNGTIDLKTGELLDHKREHMITKIAPINYDLEAKCDLWKDFLLTIMDRKQYLVDFLQRAVGYSLTGSTGEQCIFMTYGSGANGKSTFLETIEAMLGDYAKSTSMQTFLVKQGDSANNDIARLFGSRFVSTVEADEGKKLSEALVKQITGGDKITARFLHKEFFEFIPQFKIWMGTNHKPVIKGTDHGIWRRIRLIPFEVTIPEEKRDKDLLEKLKAELPGILAWAVEGCLKWQKEGLNAPDEVLKATDEYRSEMDTMKAFLNDCCIGKKDNFIQSSTLYDVYKKWSESNGEYALSQTKFSLKLKEKGLNTRKTSGLMFWQNISLSTTGNMIKAGSFEVKNSYKEKQTSFL